MASGSREDLRGIFKDYTLPIPKHRPPIYREIKKARCLGLDRAVRK
jgi:hypothetical protein